MYGAHTNAQGSKWTHRKKVTRQCMIIILATLVYLLSPLICAKQRFSPKASLVLEKKIFIGFYPSWSTYHDHFSNLSFPQPKEAPNEIWAKLAQRLQKRSRLKMLTDARTDRRMDNGQKVITIAHPEHSSGEPKIIKITWYLLLSSAMIHNIVSGEIIFSAEMIINFNCQIKNEVLTFFLNNF